MIEIESLNEYSRKVYDFLESNYCIYLKNISVLPCEIFGGNFMQFEIEPPNKKASYYLTFDTDCNRITICFDEYHCHFDSFADRDFSLEMKKSIETITKIMSDELLVFSHYREGKLYMSALEGRNFLDNFDQNSFELKYPKTDMITTVSWTGDYDGQKTISRITSASSPLPRAGRSWWQKLFGFK